MSTQKQKVKIEVDLNSELGHILADLNEEPVKINQLDYGFMIMPKSSANSKRDQLNRWTILLSFIVPILAGIFSYSRHLKQVPLVGRDSIASFFDTVGVIVATICFILSFIQQNEQMKKGWLRIITLGSSFLLINEFVAVLLAKLIGSIFPKASLDFWSALLLLLILSLVANAGMWSLGQFLSARMLINLLGLVILSGTFTAMVINGSQYWWQNNFSFLGTQDAVERWQFNLTLLVSAILLVVLINTLFSILRSHFGHLRRFWILQGMLWLTAINLGAVGFFPYSKGIFGQIHNFVAQNLVVFIIFLLLGIRWLLPVRDRDFERFSLFISLGLISTVFMFYMIHYFSLMAFELFSFIFAFWWLIRLLNFLLDSTKLNQEFILEIN